MGMINSRHKQTRKSLLVNACIAYGLGVFMIACIFIDPDADARSFIISAGIMALMGSYWLYKRKKFDDKDFNDPFKLNRDR